MAHDPTSREWVASIAREVVAESYPTVGHVRRVYPHTSDGDPWDHNADVQPLGTTDESALYKKLPILVGAPGEVRLPPDKNADYSLTSTTDDEGNETSAPSDHSKKGSPDTRPLAIVTPLTNAGGAPSHAITDFAYSTASAPPTGNVNGWRNVIGDVVIEIRANDDGEQYLQAGFIGDGGSSGSGSSGSGGGSGSNRAANGGRGGGSGGGVTTAATGGTAGGARTAGTFTAAATPLATGESGESGESDTTYGFFPGEHHADAFQQWAGTATTIVNFASDVLDAKPRSYIKTNITPIWEGGSTPLLTLEPSGHGSSVGADIANGQYDGVWHSWADAIGAYISGHTPAAKLQLRLAHEMNGNWYPWAGTPGAYISMWRHVHDIITNAAGVGPHHLEWVWCVNADDVPANNHAENYYPGDGYVDVIGIDGYNFGSDGGGWQSPSDVFEGMRSRMTALATKPIIIPETASSSMKNGSSNPGAKADWLAALASYVASNDITNVNYFNQDKESDWAVFGGNHGTGTTTI